MLAIAFLFALSTIIFTEPASVSKIPSIAHLSDSAKNATQHIHKPKLPKLTVPSIHSPFRQAAHEPPVQKNSTSGEAKWFSDWKWLHPFSSSVTLDENRSVLPPLNKRPPIYTYYEPSTKDETTRAAENGLLVAWRRAWWAQGFQPVVLGRAEAMNNPLYATLQTKKLDPVLESEILRWLAWGHMGTGILANWLTVPMGPYEDDLLSYLRRGEYPKLTRYETLGNGLFSGDTTAINAATKQALEAPPQDLEKLKSFVDTLPTGTIKVDPRPGSIAFYDSISLKIQYRLVGEKLDQSRPAGLDALLQLINSHLHTTFQNTFPKGIEVLKPLPAHSTALVEPALHLATLLAQCPQTPIPRSCPPNLPTCTPCNPTHPMQISTPQDFHNTSTIYTIGTVPHPYTLASLIAQRTNLDTRYIRRETGRDRWLLAATAKLLGADIGGSARIVRFKEAVAGVWGSSHSLWITAEKDLVPKDLDWHFGFSIPRNATAHSSTISGTGSDDTSPPPLKAPTAKDLEMEKVILAKAREALKSRERPRIGVREVLEAWNLADTEAWRFVRAYRARAKVERAKWEEGERKFAGAEREKGGRVGSAWARWFDREQ